MVWKVNKIGKEQVWYSKEEYMLSVDEINKLKDENDRLQREYDILDSIIELFKIQLKYCTEKIVEVQKYCEEQDLKHDVTALGVLKIIGE